jgi:hypothetical protein
MKRLEWILDIFDDSHKKQLANLLVESMQFIFSDYDVPLNPRFQEEYYNIEETQFEELMSLLQVEVAPLAEKMTNILVSTK